MKLEVGLRVAPLVVPVQLVAAAAEREAEDGEDGGREGGVDGPLRRRHPHCECGARSPKDAFPRGVVLSRRV